MLKFEWDNNKNKANKIKHGISFEKAVLIFINPVYLIKDQRTDYGETRYRCTGFNLEKIIFLVYTIRNKNYRIISARIANKKERHKYYEHIKKTT